MKGNICLGEDKIIEAWRSVKHHGDTSRWFGKKSETDTEMSRKISSGGERHANKMKIAMYDLKEEKDGENP